MLSLPFPDLVWTAGGIIGGYLLIENVTSISKKGKVGVWVIFGSFIFQVLWEVNNPWTAASLWQDIYVIIMVIVGVIFYIRAMRKK